MSPDKEIPEIQWIERVTKLMDSTFRIPGTNIRFGLDPILGLFPFFGDLISYGISCSLVLAMVNKGASGKVLWKMVGNITLDYIISNVPILGYIVDFGLKANERNLKLLKEHLEEGKHQGSGRKYLLIILFILIGIMAVLTFVIWKLLLEFFQWLGALSPAF